MVVLFGQKQLRGDAVDRQQLHAARISDAVQREIEFRIVRPFAVDQPQVGTGGTASALADGDGGGRFKRRRVHKTAVDRQEVVQCGRELRQGGSDPEVVAAAGLQGVLDQPVEGFGGFAAGDPAAIGGQCSRDVHIVDFSVHGEQRADFLQHRGEVIEVGQHLRSGQAGNVDVR